ncbi:hypothetical protein MON38_02215 [Hymenobacter sp. DH14]|uniref:Uncharacterized protein n=1 Tax=Hymenobacter cyanobacteriorum TaxID=2926463 RepID=A0A9X2AF89_9BACT|nr:hypothetical protein [Hymenobacter cyanobacteriorum]MCI1186218.1 hypothetical protein [Hymenobacter cyanobacteriorum]
MTSFLLACACLSSADFVARESTAKVPPQQHVQLVAQQKQPKPAAPLLAHTRHRASR